MSSIAAEDALNWFGWDTPPDGVRLIRYDARGHGRSSAPRTIDACRWSCLGADMLAVAHATDAEPFIAGGMSMGCATALHAAIQAPQRIRGLILAMPPMIWEGRTLQRKMYKRIAERGTEADGRALEKLMSRDMARTLPPWLSHLPGQMEGLAIGVRALDRLAIPGLFHGAAVSDLPPRAALSALADIPALILGWSGDSTHPVASAEELHRLLPASQLHIAHNYSDFKSFPQRIRHFVESLA